MGFLICTTNSNSRSSSLINKQRPGKAADESRRRQRGSSLNALGRGLPCSKAAPPTPPRPPLALLRQHSSGTPRREGRSRSHHQV
ncbi:uncharacterized protein C10orf143 homolog isoform X3 [Canis lupus baileyi]|uniref:uncharacterized protein C10orf143 homolog isoform X3 n=1 Tax=Canis lupus baileyi TaxID=143281 RepID=UPI003B970C44